MSLQDDGFKEELDPDPDVRHMLALYVPKLFLERYGSFDYFITRDQKTPSAEYMWIGAMQKYVVKEVILLTDDLSKDDLYIFFNFGNDPGSPMWLGKLHNGCELHNEAITKIRAKTVS